MCLASLTNIRRDILYLRIPYVPVLSILMVKHLFQAFEPSAICVERVFTNTASGASSLRFNVVTL